MHAKKCKTKLKKLKPRQLQGMQRFLKISRVLVLFFGGLIISYHLFVELTGYVVTYNRGYITTFTLTPMLLESLLFLLLYVYGIFTVKTILGNVSIALNLYLVGDRLINIVDDTTSFQLATAYWLLVIVLGVIALVFVVLRIIFIPIIKCNSGHNYFARLRKTFKVYHLIGILIISSGATWYAMGELDLRKEMGSKVTIHPQDYQIEFRFWGRYWASWYQAHPNGTQILDQMNKHNATLQDAYFRLRDADGELESFSPTVYPADVNTTVTNLAWFRDNYPNIRFQYYAYGIGYGSNGNYEGSIYSPAMVKRFVDICRNYSLPNVVGVYTDWEGPSGDAPDGNNFTMNAWHQALWADAFAYACTYFPNWTFSCCHPDNVYWDGIDGDDDLQYFLRYNIFSPMWDDYGPMVYRCCNPYETNPLNYGTSWMIYANAKAMAEGAFKDDPDKASFWLGCTGCGPYNSSLIIQEHGEPIKFGNSTGFDAFARDVLILKHFGIKTVSIFHGMETFESNTILTGFFDQYGYDDALDRLNETVNGENSTREFEIWTDADWTPQKWIIYDYLLNFNQLIYLPEMGVFFVIGFLIAFLDRLIIKNIRERKDTKSENPVHQRKT
ncbi:MAG: hypothetical protein ACFFCS_24600 [Candidatus Hodarchaeota archaeon]